MKNKRTYKIAVFDESLGFPLALDAELDASDISDPYVLAAIKHLEDELDVTLKVYKEDNKKGA